METPKVFASYSHDSDEHKQWVLKLCTKLVENGVDVMLDQWDIRLGTDQTLFMEKLGAADRVLVICTDAYVEKADNRAGGVGYEGRIITAQIAENLKTDKFIPIIRQASNEKKMPFFFGKSQYIDFTDDNKFDEKFNELLHDIHGVPISPKPPMGENPFAEQISTLDQSSDYRTEILGKPGTASDAYKRAETFIKVDNRFGLRQFAKEIRRDISNSLEEWKPEFEQQKLGTTEEILETVDKTVHIVSPLISVALASIESGEESFRDQRSVLHDLFTIAGWKNNACVPWIDMPNALRYVYHSLHGGLSLKTNQLNLALSLARENVRLNYPSHSRGRVWEMRELNGGFYFNVKSKDLWKHLATAYNRWEWLSLIFRNDGEYRTSLVAYYMALNMHELAEGVASGNQEKLGNYYRFKVPIDFLSEIYEIKGHAIDMLLSNSTLPELWTCLDVTQEQMKNSWKARIDQCKRQFWNAYQGYYFENDGIHRDHENFFENL